MNSKLRICDTNGENSANDHVPSVSTLIALPLEFLFLWCSFDSAGENSLDFTREFKLKFSFWDGKKVAKIAWENISKFNLRIILSASRSRRNVGELLYNFRLSDCLLIHIRLIDKSSEEVFLVQLGV